MIETVNGLPDSVTKIAIDSKDIYLVGTAHVSKQSVEDVRQIVALVQPDTICVELCDSRYNALTQQDRWRKMDIFKVVKEKKAIFLLAQLILNAFYKKLGEQLDVKLGAEMIEGIKLAESSNRTLITADRDIEITLKRVWGYLNFWNKLKMASQVFASFFVTEKIDESMVEQMKQQDQLENVLGTFAASFPEIKKRLIDERDVYLSQKIKHAPGNVIVAIVGAGHVPGIQKAITKETPLEPLLSVPPKSPIPQIIAWSIPIVIVSLFIIGFFRSGTQHSVESLWIWVLVNGALAALGAAAALAHPLTIIVSFLAAPLTSLNPMIAAGWVSGIVQAIVKKPTVRDFENLSHAISSVKGFWLNPVSRILLVVALANLGSSLGTFIAGSWIAGRLF